jgi:metal-responsive CopG/Arc/MetJ family transcriptional regulator
MTSSDPKDSLAKSREVSSRRAKVAVTLPNPLLARARERVRTHEAPSLSALVTQALEEKLERDRLQEVLDQMAAEYGPLTPEELAWADRLLEG